MGYIYICDIFVCLVFMSRLCDQKLVCFTVFILEIIAYSLPLSIQIPAKCSDVISDTIMERITSSIEQVQLRIILVAIISIAKIIMFLFDIPYGIIQDSCCPVDGKIFEPIMITEVNNDAVYPSIYPPPHA